MDNPNTEKKIDIHEALVDAGFDISYSTVCNTVRELTNQAQDAYIKALYAYANLIKARHSLFFRIPC